MGGLKGQFFVISMVIVVIVTATVVLFLVPSFELSFKELFNINKLFLIAESYVETLEQSQSLLNDWDLPLLSKELWFNVNDSGFFSVLTVGSDNFYSKNDYLVIPYNGTHNELLSRVSKGVVKFYSGELLSSVNSFNEVIVSGDEVRTRFYEANVNNKGVITSLKFLFDGDEYSSGNGLLVLNYKGVNQSGLSVVSSSWSNTSMGVKFETVLTNGFDINLVVDYYFFESGFKVFYVLKDSVNELSNVSIMFQPSCSTNKNLTTYESVVSDFCSGIGSSVIGEEGLGFGSLYFLFPVNRQWFSNGVSNSSYEVDKSNKVVRVVFSGSNSSEFHVGGLLFFDLGNSGVLDKVLLYNGSSIVDSGDRSLSGLIGSFSKSVERVLSEQGGSVVSDYKVVVDDFSPASDLFGGFWNGFTVSVTNPSSFDRLGVVSVGLNDSYTAVKVFRSGEELESTVFNGSLFFVDNFSAGSSVDYSVLVRKDFSVMKKGFDFLFESVNDSFLVFSNGLMFINLSNSDVFGVLNNFSFNGSVFEGVMNDFLVRVNDDFNSLSGGDFRLVNTSVSDNGLFLRVEQWGSLNGDPDFLVESVYFFYDDWFKVVRRFVDNSSVSSINGSSIWWGSNTTFFGTVNGQPISDHFYDGSWNLNVYDSTPNSYSGPSDNRFFALLHWVSGENLFVGVNFSSYSDLTQLSFGLAGSVINKINPYWAQSGSFNNPSFEVWVKPFFTDDLSKAESEGNVSYSLISEPFRISVSNTSSVPGLFDFESTFFVENGFSRGLSDFPIVFKKKIRQGFLPVFVGSKGELLRGGLVSDFNGFSVSKVFKNFPGEVLEFSLLNQGANSFNVSVNFTGAPNTFAWYNLSNPLGRVVRSGVFNNSFNFSVSNALSGFYKLRLVSNGSISTSSFFPIETGLSKVCVSSDFSFAGDHSFYFLLDEGVSFISFDLITQQGSNVYEYSVFDFDGSKIVSNTFSEGRNVSVRLNLRPVIGDRVLRVDLHGTITPINWLGVKFNDFIPCISLSEDSLVSLSSPEVNVLAFVSTPPNSTKGFKILTSDDYLVKNDDPFLFNFSGGVLSNGFMSVSFDDSPIIDLGNGNLVSNGWFSSLNSVNSFNFSDSTVLLNESQRIVLRGFSNGLSFDFLNYPSQNFFEVVVKGFNKGDDLVLGLGVVGGLFKTSNSLEGLVEGDKLFGYDDLGCSSGSDFVYAGKKNGSVIVSLVVPCDYLRVSSEAVNVSEMGVSFNASTLSDEIKFFVLVVKGFNWLKVEDFISMLSGVSVRREVISYDWVFTSDNLVIS